LETGNLCVQAANPTTVGQMFREVIFNFEIKTSVCNH